MLPDGLENVDAISFVTLTRWSSLTLLYYREVQEFDLVMSIETRSEAARQLQLKFYLLNIN